MVLEEGIEPTRPCGHRILSPARGRIRSMNCNQILALSNIASPLIAACAGLAGVALGGAITIWSQTKERRQARIREKLDKFYSPLLGIRKQILAKSEVRKKVHHCGEVEWPALFVGITSPEEKARITKERWPAFEAMMQYSEGQLKKELVPLYNQMVLYFTTNMQFAEDATREHFGALVEFTELWNRNLQSPMPPEVVLCLKHDEKTLYPFYDDLEAQFRMLRKKLE